MAFEVEASRSERSGNTLCLVVFASQRGRDTDERIDALLASIESRKRQYDTIGLLESHRVGVLLPYTTTSGAWAFAEDVLKRNGDSAGRLIATVSSNEVSPSGTPTPAMRPKEVATPPVAPRTRKAIDPAVPEEVKEEVASHAGAAIDAPTVASIWHEFGRQPSRAKRVVDIVGSSMALVLLSPLLLGSAAAVKASSPGPVFFLQERAGQFGKPFKLVKFRSMFIDAEARKQALMHLNEMDGPVFKIKNDPRITPIGRWLRRLSIDELPQFYNVLRGDMSLVGPRPPLPSELPGYEQWHLRRLTRRGGLTCIWQTSGRNQVPFKEWMRMDRRYMRQESMVTDLSLIAKTVWTVTIGRGAS
ncbi:MAG: sugar transferase [Planctomycetota bacterium]|nr:sugar transferase [Planctomycetota bacterium]